MAHAADPIVQKITALPGTITSAKQAKEFHKAIEQLQNYDAGKHGPFPAAAADALTPKLDGIIRSTIANDKKASFEDEVLFAIKGIVTLMTPKGIDTVIHAIRAGYAADNFIWHIVLGILAEYNHPGVEKLFTEMKRELPDGAIVVPLLEAANTACIEHGVKIHPFDSDPGQKILLTMLEEPPATARQASDDGDDEDMEDEALGPNPPAITAIAFLDPARRAPLLEAAAKVTNDPRLRLEYNWVRAKLGDPAGIAGMVEAALDVATSWTAVGQMRELGLDDHIPAKALEPRFAAAAELSNWFGHPNEVGEPPTRMVHVDSRTIWWPPTKDEREMHIFRAEYDPSEHRDEAEAFLGVVGSITFSLLDDELAKATPEKIYGAHCLWELSVNNDPREIEDAPPSKGWEMIQKRL